MTHREANVRSCPKSTEFVQSLMAINDLKRFHFFTTHSICADSHALLYFFLRVDLSTTNNLEKILGNDGRSKIQLSMTKHRE